MKRFTWRWVVAAIAVVGGAPLCAQEITLDARGQAQVRRTVPSSSVVTVKIENKNPFLHKYRLTVNETVVQETAPLGFIAQLSPLLGTVAAASPSSAAPPGGAKSWAAMAGEIACDAAPKPTPARVKELTDAVAVLIQKKTNAEADLKTAVDNYTSAKASYDAAHNALRNPNATTDGLELGVSRLKATQAQFPKPEDVDALDASVRDVTAAAKAVSAMVDAFQKAFPTCRILENGVDNLLNIRVLVDGLAGAWTDAARGQITRIREALVALKTSLDAADRIVAERQFEDTRSVGNYDGPTNVTITLDRWPAADTDEKGKETIAKAVIAFGGGSRFVLSGGLGVARLRGDVRRQEFQQVRGYEKKVDGTSGQELTTVVGLKRDEQKIVVPALLLNTRLWAAAERRAFRSVYLTFGITAKKEGDVDVDYLAGLSAGVLSDKVLLTVAVDYANVQKLGGDLYLGAKIPEALTTIPVEKRRAAGVAFLVTYKIK